MEHRDPRRTDTGGTAAPPNEDEAAALAARLRDRATSFVSFQDVPVLQVNPDYSNDVTPGGIYGFPVDWMLLVADGFVRHGGAGSRLARQGCVRRPHAFVFDVAGRVLDLGSYRGFAEDAERLDAWVTRHHPDARHVVNAWRFNGNPQFGTDMDGRRLLGMSEKVVDQILGIAGSDDPYAAHPAKPGMWREAFLSMGISALLDRVSLLTGGDFPHQIAVFDEAAIVAVECFDNPCSAAGHVPSPPASRR